MAWRVYKKDRGRTKYTIQGRDHHNVRRQMPAYRDKALSEELGRHVARLVEYKRQKAPLPPLLAAWVHGLAPDIKDRLAGFGLLEAHTRPLNEHLTDYKAHLEAKGNTEQYVQQTINRVCCLIDGCRFRYWADVQASKAQQFIAALKSSKTQAATALTQNYYLRDLKSFARWAVRDGRLPESPIEHMRPLSASKVRNDRRHERRALTVHEAQRLLSMAHQGPERYGMDGPARSLAYRLCIETGLRSSELRSLTRAAFDLSHDEPTVTVQAAYTKNRQEAMIPLRAETAVLLVGHLATKTPSAPAFNMPAKDQVIDMLKADLRDAGIPYRIDPKHGKVVDLHSLRHTTGSWLAAAGVHPKVFQRIMRHSTITLTMDRYTHAFKGDEAEAVNKLPSLSWPGDDAASATGTSDVNPLPSLRGAMRGAPDGKQWTDQRGAVDSSGSWRASDDATKTTGNKADLTLGTSVVKMDSDKAGVAELADATDSKSVGVHTPWRFESSHRYSIISLARDCVAKR